MMLFYEKKKKSEFLPIHLVRTFDNSLPWLKVHKLQISIDNFIIFQQKVIKIKAKITKIEILHLTNFLMTPLTIL